MNRNRLRSRFLGSILGSVIGDSWGASYEGRYYPVDVEDFQFVGGNYTDDSEMMKGVLESLLATAGKFDGAHMANRFVENYDYRRGYGANATSVLMQIKDGQPWDRPAKESFYGAGSFGNGAAMRICPVGLLFHNELTTLESIADQVSAITHTHSLGKQGALLQAYAVALAVQEDPRSFEPVDFVKKLCSLKLSRVYLQKLERIETYLSSSPPIDRIISQLGVNITAQESVPIAIYNFLSNATNFYEVLYSSIRCGGDTDTIACMSGALAGAFLGIEKIPKEWVGILEDTAIFQQLANDLFELFLKKSSK